MKKLLFIFAILFFYLFFLPTKVHATIFQGPSGSFDYNFDSNLCSQFDPISSDITEITVTDLSPCIDALGQYQTTCCRDVGGCPANSDPNLHLSQWQYNWANGCIAKSSGGGFCTVKFSYGTQTCQVTDTCYSPELALRPGLCTENVGCTIGTTQYKYCCNGACNGGEYTGSCPNGNFVFCGGAGQPACNQSACATATPTATPTPTPGACPTTGGWEGGPCAPGSSNVAETCNGGNSNTCNYCSVKSCLQYSGSLYCWYNDRNQCYNDPNFCKGLNCSGTTCIPGSQIITCDANFCHL